MIFSLLHLKLKRWILEETNTVETAGIKFRLVFFLAQGCWFGGSRDRTQNTSNLQKTRSWLFKRKHIFRFFSDGYVIAQSGMILRRVRSLEKTHVPWKKSKPWKKNRLPAQYRSCHSYPFLVILGYPYARHMLCWIRSWIGILIRLQDCLHCFLDRFALACLHGYLMSGPPSNGEWRRGEGKEWNSVSSEERREQQKDCSP